MKTGSFNTNNSLVKYSTKKTQITNIMNNWWLVIWFYKSMVIGNIMNNNILTNLIGEIGLIVCKILVRTYKKCWNEQTVTPQKNQGG